MEAPLVGDVNDEGANKELALAGGLSKAAVGCQGCKMGTCN